MDPSLIDAFAARSLGIPMEEMLRTRHARTGGPRTATRYLDRGRRTGR